MEAQAVHGRTEELLRHLSGRRRLLILTHVNPDPDSLASAMGLRQLAEAKLGLSSTFGYAGRILRAENQTMVRRCGIEMVPQEQIDFSAFDCLAVVDTQPGFGHTHLPKGRKIDVVIDHHVTPDDYENGFDIGFRDVRTYVGATCSLVTSYLMEAGVEVSSEVATALMYGIKTDTADLSRNTSPLDEQAYEYLAQRVDRQVLAQIAKPDLSIEYFRALRKALSAVRIYDDVVLCSLGQTSSPEMVAEVADLLLRLEGKSTVFCGGLVGTTYYMSVRTELDVDAYYLIRGALDGEGSYGGHGSVAGGCKELPDGESRSLKRWERVLERNILRSMHKEDVSLATLGGEQD